MQQVKKCFFIGHNQEAVSGHILKACCDHNLEISLLLMKSLLHRREGEGWFEATVAEKGY